MSIKTISYVLSHPLAKRHRLRCLYIYFWWQLRGLFNRHPATISWVDNSRLRLTKGMRGATGNLYCGLHEWPDMAFALHLLRPGDLFIDVGANVGTYTVLAASVAKASVIALEPSGEALPSLRDNIRINHVDDKVKIVEACAGRANGVIQFSKGEGPENHVLASFELAKPSQAVPVVRLDDIAAAKDAVLLKIDVEGMEEEVLAGAANLINSSSLKSVLTEGRQPYCEQALLSAGFIPCDYEPFSRLLISNVLTKNPNQLWVKDPSWVYSRLKNSARFSVLGESV
jgi:FkbM family methyltransferase